MGFPESLVYHRYIIVLLKTILSVSKAKRNITRKTSRKFLPRHVIRPPCLYQVLHIFKSLHRFPAILPSGVSSPSDQELPPAVPLPRIKDSLNFPLLLVIYEDRCWFGMAPSWESFVIIGMVWFHY